MLQRLSPAINISRLTSVFAALPIVAAAALSAASPAAAADFAVLHHFRGFEGDGGRPNALIFGESTKELLGVTGYGGGIFRLTPQGPGQPWRREMLHRFSKGENASTGLTRLGKKLYGATDYDSTGVYGAIYEFNPANRVYRKIFDFDRDPGQSGAIPQAPLLAWKGALYGTTTQGGSGRGGVIFRLRPPEDPTKGWKFNVLKSFRGPNGFNGGRVGLTPRRGELFGATFAGGPQGEGVVFRIAPDPDSGKWVQTVLSTFRGGDNGRYPESPLLLSRDGKLYGTAGGDGYDYDGNVFRMVQKKGSWVRESIFRFHSAPDQSAFPAGRLVEDSQGRIYGVASGSYPELGVVYRLSRPTASHPKWRFEILHRFQDQDGSKPESGLLLDETDGKVILYGTTSQGGRFKAGTVFRLTP